MRQYREMTSTRMAQLAGATDIVWGIDGHLVLLAAYWNCAGEVAGEQAAVGIVFSVTLPRADAPHVDGGWIGDWAAFIGAGPGSGDYESLARVVHDWGAHLSEDEARIYGAVTDLPYRE